MSVAVTLTVNLPGPVLAVPEMPPAEFIDKPFGRPLAVNVYEPVPPDAVTDALYGAFCVAFGSTPGAGPPSAVMLIAHTRRFKPWCTVEAPSVRVKLKLFAFGALAAVGVPESTPFASSVKPAGTGHEGSAVHVTPPALPAAVNVCE